MVIFNSLLLQWGQINTIHHDFWVQFPVSHTVNCMAMAYCGGYTFNAVDNWIKSWDWYQFNVCRQFGDIPFTWISIGF